MYNIRKYPERVGGMHSDHQKIEWMDYEVPSNFDNLIGRMNRGEELLQPFLDNDGDVANNPAFKGDQIYDLIHKLRKLNEILPTLSRTHIQYNDLIRLKDKIQYLKNLDMLDDGAYPRCAAYS